MDHGRIIAQGDPSQLLQHHFSERLVRLPEETISQATLKLLGEVRHRNGWVEILTTEVNETLSKLLEHDIDLNHLQVRQRNLEDLFLELTGKELRQ
jgi:ABC-2 type transport system ATP-binding protein